MIKVRGKSDQSQGKSDLGQGKSTDVTYKERLISLNLLSICYWHEFQDLVFFYKATRNIISIDPSVLPIVRSSTRTTRISVRSTQLLERKGRTTTYQKSFLVRTTRIWNLLTLTDNLMDLTIDNFTSELVGTTYTI